MILNRVKEGVHGFPGDGTLIKNVRGAVLINMNNADYVMSAAEAMAAFKFVLNPGTGKKLIVPAGLEKYFPTNFYIGVYTSTNKLTLRFEALNQDTTFLAVLIGSYLPGVGSKDIGKSFTQFSQKTHEPYSLLDDDYTFALSDAGGEFLFDPATPAGKTVYIDGSLAWDDDAEIVVINSSGNWVNVEGINGFTVFGLTYVPAYTRCVIGKYGSTNSWYCTQ